MLRAHHSLKAFCATLWWRWAVFYQVFQVMEHQWHEIDRGKPTTRRKTCPNATLSTTNPTWTDPGSNGFHFRTHKNIGRHEVRWKRWAADLNRTTNHHKVLHIMTDCAHAQDCGTNCR
jgi:hypothetical protein